MICARMFVLLLIAGAARGQSPEMRAPASDEPSTTLPDAPQPVPEQQASRATNPIAIGHELPVRIKGVVSDMQGGLVPGAHIVIACDDSATTQEATADSVGFFSISNLPAGTYSVTISSPGLETYIVRDLHLKPGETYSMPEVSLPMARTAADITVTVTTEEMAEQELQNELHQRVLGVLPNFYTSYQWDAAPLSPRQKLKLTIRAASDPVFLGTTAITAGISLARNDQPEYGAGAAGYWSRYGSAYGDAVIGRFMGSVVFSSVFHQDPRYFVMTNGSWERRAWHAVSSTFMQRNDKTRRFEPAYANLLGAATAGLIASTYHPGSSPGKMVLDDTVLDLGNKAVNNLIREFVLRHLAKHIPSYAKGRPPED
jgi:hypothetical protein